MKRLVRFAVFASLTAGLLTFVFSCAGQQQQQAQDAEELTRGEEAYLAYCAMCHGDTGAGNGPLAAALTDQGATSPVRLDNAERLAALGPDELRRIIVVGGLHTGRTGVMPPWGERLDSTLVKEVVEHIMTLPSRKPVTPTATLEKFMQAPEGSATDGRRAYVHYCSICHGPDARGDGFYADSLWARNNIRPRDLTDSEYLGAKTDEELYVAIALGGAHGGKSTFMPAWTVTLSPQEIKSLISYVRAISGTSSPDR